MTDGDGHRLRLRSATRNLHDRLDSAVEELLLADGRDGYVALLRSMVRGHQWAERHLHGLDDLALSGHGTKVEAARRDLAELGAVGDHAGAPPARAVHAADEVDGTGRRDELLGMLYVVEGSTLGGRVLAEQVNARFPGAPTRFLLCYGDDVLSRWRRTVHLIDASVVDDRQAAFGARLTFEHFLGELT